jgi:hypothetical protein
MARTPKPKPPVAPLDLPVKGDRYHCPGCGMALEITQDCACEDGSWPCFECCGKEMVKLD